MLKTKISKNKETKLIKEYIALIGHCEACGIKNDSLVVHHLEKKLSHPELRMEKSNWIVLDWKCHLITEVGGVFNGKKYTAKEFNDYLKEIKNTQYLLDNVGNAIKRLK
jgi:hypothetical protein